MLCVVLLCCFCWIVCRSIVGLLLYVVVVCCVVGVVCFARDALFVLVAFDLLLCVLHLVRLCCLF